MRYKPVDLGHPCLPKGWKPMTYERIFHAMHSSHMFPVYKVRILLGERLGQLEKEAKFWMEVGVMGDMGVEWSREIWIPVGLLMEIARMLREVSEGEA